MTVAAFLCTNFLIFRNGIFHAKPGAGEPEALVADALGAERAHQREP
jgi:hypothetical protein